MYPLEMKPDGAECAVEWHADESGVLLEQTYVETRIVWPADAEFRYSEHLAPSMLKSIAGRNALEIWPEKEGPQPSLV